MFGMKGRNQSSEEDDGAAAWTVCKDDRLWSFTVHTNSSRMLNSPLFLCLSRS